MEKPIEVAKFKLVPQRKFKGIFTWLLGLTFLAYLLLIFWIFLVHGVTPSLIALYEKQWLAMIVFPSASFAALVAVMVVESASGNIEFKCLGFEFKGAAAPLVMWALLNLVFAVSLNLLWQK